MPINSTRLVVDVCFLLPTSMAGAATITHENLDATTKIVGIEERRQSKNQDSLY